MSTTTTTVIIVAIIVMFGIIGTVLVARTRRRQAQARQRMGLPDLGTLAGEPITKVTVDTITNRGRGAGTSPGAGPAKS